MNFECINDETMFNECIDKIEDLNEYDLINLIKNILNKHPEVKNTILKY